MTQNDYSPEFLFNLSKVLAHTIWYEAKNIAVLCHVDDALLQGDPPAPTASETTAAQLQAFTQYLPGLFEVLRPEQAAQERFNLETQRELQPQLADLNADLLEEFGPRYNQVGADLSRQNALLQSETDKMLMEGSGRDLVRSTIDTQRIADPEYYATREATSKAYNDLVGSYDVSGLSPSEAASIERMTNRSNSRSGNAGTGSPSNAIKNAFAFDDKLQTKKNNLANVLNMYQGIQSGNRSGVDASLIATGKPASSGFNSNQFQGVQPFGTGSAEVSGTGNNFLAQTGENARQTNQINSQRRDTLDRVNETQQAVGSWLSV